MSATPDSFGTDEVPLRDVAGVLTELDIDTVTFVKINIEGGEFEVKDTAAAARAAFDATSRFHNPAHAAEWSRPGTDAAYEGVRTLVLRGLERRHSRAET